MIQYDNKINDVLSLFSYHSSQYMIKSLLFRKQAQVDTVENSSMISWGPCLIIGGKFSDAIFKMLNEKISKSNNLFYINSPEGEWKTNIKNAFSANLTEKQINLYRYDEQRKIVYPTEHPLIVQITDAWFQRELSNSQLIKDEIYSYLTIDDFLQNGFGLALVIDNKVCGYCLSEYSIDNECAITIWIDEKYRGAGYAKMMTRLFLQHCKNNNWNVFWGCVSDNIPSNKVAQSTGFVLHSKQSYYEWNGGSFGS